MRPCRESAIHTWNLKGLSFCRDGIDAGVFGTGSHSTANRQLARLVLMLTCVIIQFGDADGNINADASTGTLDL